MEGEPRSGPCSPWVQGSSVEKLPWVADAIGALQAKEQFDQQRFENLCGEAAAAASATLYELSGRIFTGECGPVTIRPVSRPVDMDTRAGAAGIGWSGDGSSFGMTTPGLAHYGRTNPPEVDLGVHPVTEIIQVKIDGEVIPPAEYELRDHRRLVRLRTSASALPTARFGWPTTQIPDLPDTEPGTFSITYTFGQSPPAMGVAAATKLAEYLALPRLGDSKHYPQRVTNVQRQGVSAMVVDVMDVLKSKASGIYEVDLFLLTYNPKRLQRQSRVFSPDRGKPRRTATPSTT